MPYGGRITRKRQWWFASTEAGMLFLMEKLELATYDIPFPPDFKITTQVVIFLDKFIDCPYFLTNKGLTVTNEKKAPNRILFRGDVSKTWFG